MGQSNYRHCVSLTFTSKYLVNRKQRKWSKNQNEPFDLINRCFQIGNGFLPFASFSDILQINTYFINHWKSRNNFFLFIHQFYLVGRCLNICVITVHCRMWMCVQLLIFTLQVVQNRYVYEMTAVRTNTRQRECLCFRRNNWRWRFDVSVGLGFGNQNAKIYSNTFPTWRSHSPSWKSLSEWMMWPHIDKINTSKRWKSLIAGLFVICWVVRGTSGLRKYRKEDVIRLRYLWLWIWSKAKILILLSSPIHHQRGGPGDVPTCIRRLPATRFRLWWTAAIEVLSVEHNTDKQIDWFQFDLFRL